MKILNIEVAGRYPELWVYSVTVSTWFGLSSKSIECYKTVNLADNSPHPSHHFIISKTGGLVQSMDVEQYNEMVLTNQRKNAVHKAKVAAYKRTVESVLNASEKTQ